MARRCPKCNARLFAEWLFDRHWHRTCMTCGFEGLDFAASPPARTVQIDQPSWEKDSPNTLDFSDRLAALPESVMAVIQQVLRGGH